MRTWQAIHDKLESQIRTAEAKLETLRARAENARADAPEAKAIAELLTKKQVIRQKLQELKGSGGDRWQQGRAELETQIADFEKSVKGIEGESKLRFEDARDTRRLLEESTTFVRREGEEVVVKSENQKRIVAFAVAFVAVAAFAKVTPSARAGDEHAAKTKEAAAQSVKAGKVFDAISHNRGYAEKTRDVEQDGMTPVARPGSEL